jgi:hypothetical protein
LAKYGSEIKKDDRNCRTTHEYGMDALEHLQSTSYLSKLTKQYQNSTYFLKV